VGKDNIMPVKLLADNAPITYLDFDSNFTELYPVGTVACTTQHATPAAWRTALGFGTWEVYSSGRSIIGVDVEGNTSSNSTGPYRSPTNRTVGQFQSGTARDMRSITSARAVSSNTIRLTISPAGTPISDAVGNRLGENLAVGQKITLVGLTGGTSPNGTVTIRGIVSGSNNASIDVTVSSEPVGTVYGVSNAYYDLFGAAEETDGHVKHTITVSQMPRHRHQIAAGEANYAKIRVVDHRQSLFHVEENSSIPATGTDYVTSSVGGDEGHDNLMPYKVVYMYKRTA
jgi:hypothetical protein